LFVIAKVVDGKIARIYNQKTYKLEENASKVLNNFHDVGMLLEYKVYEITGFVRVVK